MHPLRKKLNRNVLIRNLSSVRITVICLSLLFILTLWGTIDQVTNGLYIAQARFFHSWAFTFLGFVPFPGARLVLWVLFINLVCAGLVRHVYTWPKAGIIITHIGLMIFFVAAFVTFHGVVESNITLMEGEGSNVSSAYHDWELSIWTQDQEIGQKDVIAFDMGYRLKREAKFSFDKYGLTVIVKSYYPNCSAYGDEESQYMVDTLNASRIQVLKPKPLDKAPEKNFPGGIFRLLGSDQGDVDILLYGGETKPLAIEKGGQTYYVKLRRKRFPLPFILKLKNFVKDDHPNTDMARSYESLVEVITKGVPREVLISMNEPLRYKRFTLYQASYQIDQLGREYSTLAVVENSGRLLPYIATFVICIGLLIHLLIMAFRPRTRVRKGKGK